jgi:hypothetical protein
MSRKDRRDGERRPSERRDSQPDDEGQRRSNEPNPQESDSLTALKAVLAKVAGLLEPLRLSPDESIRLVEQLYGSFLEADVRLAGEADDRRKSSVLAHINNTTVTRGGDNKIVVEYPAAPTPRTEAPAGEVTRPPARTADATLSSAPAAEVRPSDARPRQEAPAARPEAETPVAVAPEQTTLDVQPRAPRPPARPRAAAAPRAAAPRAAAPEAVTDTPRAEATPERPASDIPPMTEGDIADLV